MPSRRRRADAFLLGLLFGDENVVAQPELNIEEVVSQKKAETGQVDHAEHVAQRV